MFYMHKGGWVNFYYYFFGCKYRHDNWGKLVCWFKSPIQLPLALLNRASNFFLSVGFIFKFQTILPFDDFK